MDTRPLREFLTEALHPIDGEIHRGIGANLAPGASPRALALSTSSIYGTGQSITWVKGREHPGTGSGPCARSPTDRPHHRPHHGLGSPPHLLSRRGGGRGSGWGTGGSGWRPPSLRRSTWGPPGSWPSPPVTSRSPERGGPAGGSGATPPPLPQGGGRPPSTPSSWTPGSGRPADAPAEPASSPASPRRNGGGLSAHFSLQVIRPSTDLSRIATRFEPRLPRPSGSLTRGLGTPSEAAPPTCSSILMFQPDYLQALMDQGGGGRGGPDGGVAGLPWTGNRFLPSGPGHGFDRPPQGTDHWHEGILGKRIRPDRSTAAGPRMVQPGGPHVRREPAAYPCQ